MLLAGYSDASENPAVTPPVQLPWSVTPKIVFNPGCHTSYEFGNPFPPGQSPLSRLEFPLATWWGGVELRRDFPRFSIGIEGLTNISGDADSKMKDSDWDDEQNPTVKTIYSESSCRQERSWMVKGDIDLKVSDWLGLPDWLDIRPLAGFRWQYLDFMVHDGIQYTLYGSTPIEPLPGDVLRFNQTWWNYFAGIRSRLGLGRPFGLPRTYLNCQFDLGYAEGDNKDHHLMREGTRYTFENTTGDALHGSAGLKMDITSHLAAGIEFDWLKIESTGSHQLINKAFDVDLTFDNGVRSWSEQISIMFSMDYRF